MPGNSSSIVTRALRSRLPRRHWRRNRSRGRRCGGCSSPHGRQEGHTASALAVPVAADRRKDRPCRFREGRSSVQCQPDVETWFLSACEASYGSRYLFDLLDFRRRHDLHLHIGSHTPLTHDRFDPGAGAVLRGPVRPRRDAGVMIEDQLLNIDLDLKRARRTAHAKRTRGLGNVLVRLFHGV